MSSSSRAGHLEAMQQKGLRVESPLGEIVLRHVNATETPADVGFVDMVVFAVKAYDTESAAAAIVPLVGPATRVVTLQNGVDSVDAVARTFRGRKSLEEPPILRRLSNVQA